MKICIFKAPGQLGNCLYRLANVIAYAREFDCKVFDPSFSTSKYASAFESTRKQAFISFPESVELPFMAAYIQRIVRKVCRYLIKYDILKMPVVMDCEHGYNLLELRKKCSGKVSRVCLEGVHFCADELVKKHKPFLQSWFQPCRKLRQKVETLHARLCTEADLMVGVHIRRGDFKQWRGGRFFFPISTYAKIMKEFEAQVDGRVRFIVFGNGDSEVEAFDYDNLDVVFAQGSAVEDLYHLSLCDRLIGTMYSTFSGWASYYGDVPIFRVCHENHKLRLNEFKVLDTLNNTFGREEID